MNLTTREIETLCDACVRCGNFYMAAVACVALGAGYDWSGLQLSAEQAASVRSLNAGGAMKIVLDFAWEAMG